MSILDEVITIAEGNELIGKGRTYLNDMIAAGKLLEGCHYRNAGRVKLVLKSVVEKIKRGESVMIKGKKWEELEEYEKEMLLSKANCVDGETGNNAYAGECIVDLTETLSVAGALVDGEIVIDDEAVIYCPIA